MKRELLDQLLAAQADKHPTVVATRLATGEQALLTGGKSIGVLSADDALHNAADSVLRADKGRTIETAGGDIFLQPFNPPLRMAIVGAVHIAQALAPMAAIAGYDVTVIDPRHGFASPARFPEVSVVDDWPDEALDAIVPDSRTAIVTLTHDPKLDDPALERALKSEAFYIGSLGSRKTHAARLERLTMAGFGDTDFGRINGPVGLSIGARSPAEIAVSIMAQITQALRQAPAPAETAAAA
jgi:xanthine dehydrogenase accessory factor